MDSEYDVAGSRSLPQLSLKKQKFLSLSTILDLLQFSESFPEALMNSAQSPSGVFWQFFPFPSLEKESKIEV